MQKLKWVNPILAVKNDLAIIPFDRRPAFETMMKDFNLSACPVVSLYSAELKQQLEYVKLARVQKPSITASNRYTG